MSTTSPNPAVERCQPADATPVSLKAATLESTAPEYLRDLKATLTAEGMVPAELIVEACFDADCSLATQEEVDRIRGYVRAGSFLGVGTVTVSVGDVADPEKVRPALAACAERADREGLAFDLEGSLSLAE
ncbi:hypothetical protein NP511_02340 [Natrinema thermotolerans]|uniref:DUF7961 domain-containing protein n=1 Tax=Natrinema thermotolerans TaxID=121872 RepID=A0AAF0T1A6_9EURY|nr:hypothetical protein [Natrinema thermotolerans]QCC60798.1 hypothetical protein DVR14_20020 [Natrinema thermotolerans]QCC61677.1 hypothetical protein DVR14_24160 [Natrinema thermotolerans]WMT07848.1 hypothetical protein NP511_21055 [Natrinema thermotolerans]WMT08480.1 hypothetical protein NP511_02340 [Natrinema thermotolerans]